MKILLSFSCILSLFVSCSPEPKNNDLSYQNIIIISDMSSRLDNKPSKDLEKIHEIVTHFKTDCVKPGQKIGDNSSISFLPFSKKVTASIDLEKFKGVKKKQSFINSTGIYKKNGLSEKLVEFENKVKNTYSDTRNNGLDLISILMEKIENESIIKKDTTFSTNIDTTTFRYDNHIYIFTDGYLEYLDRSNTQFYFGNSEIEKVRQFCKTKNLTIVEAIQQNNSLSLPPLTNDKNKHISLHIMETHERDKNDKLQSYKYPKGLRDNEILQAIWKKWALESGFKSFDWKKY